MTRLYWSYECAADAFFDSSTSCIVMLCHHQHVQDCFENTLIQHYVKLIYLKLFSFSFTSAGAAPRFHCWRHLARLGQKVGPQEAVDLNTGSPNQAVPRAHHIKGNQGYLV